MKTYELIKNFMYKNASRFSKKHGSWLVLYLPQRQIVFMDTWNGYIYQADMFTDSVVDDGYVDCQLRDGVHNMTAEHFFEKWQQKDKIKSREIEAVKIYKTLLLTDLDFV
jgi:hypothetical protein